MGNQSAKCGKWEILTRPGAEAHVHQLGVANDGNLPSVEWVNQKFAVHVRVSGVIRVHRHGGVAEHGFRTRRGHHDFAKGFVLEFVREAPNGAKLYFPVLPRNGKFRAPGEVHVVHFDVGYRGLQPAAPVHEAVVAVHQTLGVHAHERLLHGFG